MSHHSEEGEPFRLSPDEAFTVLGNETRIEILQALWEAHDPYVEDDAVTFSTLYDAVSIDDTGNFNYHLGELSGHFVVETEDGYRLAEPGFRVTRAIVAGTATGNPTLDPTPVEVACPRCGSGITVSHEDGVTWARCTHCKGFWPQQSGEIIGFGLPPRGLHDRSPREILDATIVYSLRRANALSDGVCPDCAGTVDSSLDVCEDHEVDKDICTQCDRHFLGLIKHVCNSCKYAFKTPSWDPLHRHPALIAFYHAHDIDHVLTESWTAMQRGFDWNEELLSPDPPCVEITVSLEGDELRATIDRTGNVADITK